MRLTKEQSLAQHSDSQGTSAVRSKWVIAITALSGVILTEPAMAACPDSWVLCKTPDCSTMMQEQQQQCGKIEEIQSDVNELKGDIADLKRAIEEIKRDALDINDIEKAIRGIK